MKINFCPTEQTFFAEHKQKEAWGTEDFVQNEHITEMYSVEFLFQQDKRLIYMKSIITNHTTLEIIFYQ